MLLPLTIAVALAAPPPEAQKAGALASAGMVQPKRAAASNGFSFLALLQTRSITTNVVPTNQLLDGQIVGRLGGSNLTTVLTDKGLDLNDDNKRDEDQGLTGVVEQRLSAFLTYAPPIYDGRLGMTAGFEVDFAWGDQSYSTAGNTGGGIGGDQVNIQTRRLHFNYKPKTWEGHDLDVVAGLQFVSDTVHNPAAAAPDDLFRSGGGIRFWGTEMAGVSAFGTYRDDWGERLRYRLGVYTPWEGGPAIDDDVKLFMLDVAYQPAYALWLGVHGWAMDDRSNGRGGGILGTGPTSGLSALQGGPHLNFQLPNQDLPPEIDAQVLWVGADLGWNHRLDRGPIGATVLAVGNVGKLYIDEQVDVDVQGWLADAEIRARYAPGQGSVLRASVLATSRDEGDRNQYTGLMTGNQYGIVGAVYATSGCLLLFPDPRSINRMTPVVSDLSNRGEGLVGTTFSAGYDAIPNKLNLRLGGGWAQDGTGLPMGTEGNATATWHPWLFTDLSLAYAQVVGSEVPMANGRPLPGDPWTVILSMQNLLF